MPIIAQTCVHCVHTVHPSPHGAFSFHCPQCPSHPHCMLRWGSVFMVLTSSANFGHAQSFGGVKPGMNALLLSPAKGRLDIKIWFAAHVENLRECIYL